MDQSYVITTLKDSFMCVKNSLLFLCCDYRNRDFLNKQWLFSFILLLCLSFFVNLHVF